MLEIDSELTGTISFQLMATARQISHGLQTVCCRQVIEPLSEKIGAALTQRLTADPGVVANSLQRSCSKRYNHYY